jgi:hypothetical protein
VRLGSFILLLREFDRKAAPNGLATHSILARQRLAELSPQSLFHAVALSVRERLVDAMLETEHASRRPTPSGRTIMEYARGVWEMA